MSSSKSYYPGGAVATAWRLESVQEARKRLLEQTEAAPTPPPPPPPPPPVPEIDFEALAREVEAEARARGYEEGRAEGLIAGTEAGLAEGREAGLAEGRQEALAAHEEALASDRAAHREAMEQELLAFRESLQGFVDSSYSALREWRKEITEVHTGFALETARRAIGEELQSSRSSVLALAKEALAELHQGTEFRILVNPADASFLDCHRQEIQEQFTHVRGLEIVPDRAIQGGVVIESQSGTIDARIEAYLQRMAENGLRAREAA